MPRTAVYNHLPIIFALHFLFLYRHHRPIPVRGRSLTGTFVTRPPVSRQTTLTFHKMSHSTHDSQETEQPHLLLSKLSKIGQTDESSNSNVRLILASQSPRRSEIMNMMGLAGRFVATPSPMDEQAVQLELLSKSSTEVQGKNSKTNVAVPSLSPREYAQTLADRKAHAMSLHVTAALVEQDSTHPPPRDEQMITVIIGSDTIVEFEKTIMEKPVDRDDAFSMLQRLSGNWHQVHTGVAIYAVFPKDKEASSVAGRENSTAANNIQCMVSFTDTARVKFGILSEQDIQSYIATNEPMDKAGSYGIQGIGGQLVERIEGDFFTVMGLPMHRLSKALSEVISSLGY